jgi:membrane associated rhomboid family serine protease
MKIQKNIQIALVAVGILWLVHLLNYVVPIDLRLYGLRPRHIDGLWGIVSSPLLHGNFSHLIANSITLFVLLTVSLSFSRKLTIMALLIIALVGGGLVWVFGGSDTIHIGTSGIIFGLIGFLMFMGIFRREWIALFCSIAIFICYGGALLSLLFSVPGISWTGHFFGLFTGVLAAWWTKTNKRK